MRYTKLLVTLGIVAVLAGFAGVVAAGSGTAVNASATNATTPAASTLWAGFPTPHAWTAMGNCTHSQGNTTIGS